MSITIKHLSHIYAPGTPFEYAALSDVCLEIPDGQYVAVIGHTGSGKSTLIQHLNGLIRPTSGSITVQGIDLTEKKVPLRELRRRVGLVFQYPEYQLFEETVAKDVAFGPGNLGLSQEEITERVNEALNLVGLPESVAEMSPFDLSGGQKRRAAIAGVLSMRPEVLVLDEPIAGLDPLGRHEILSLVENYRRKYGATVILVSHNMDDVADIAERVIVMNKGTVALDGSPRQVFSQTEQMRSMGLDVPQVAILADLLRSRGMDVPQGIITEQEMLGYLLDKGVAGCSRT
ncbi:MAG: energy-coupling factor transporter ATPase [Firmicutes bacterium]|nr:energy-coupling factor transporter ATPase [Bacillota bacterium]